MQLRYMAAHNVWLASFRGQRDTRQPAAGQYVRPVWFSELCSQRDIVYVSKF